MQILDQYTTDRYTLINGDTTEVITSIPDNSIGFSVYSPPFSSLYTYSNSDRDLGNSKNDEEFFEHFSFIVRELFRILMPGRIMAVHCMNLPTSKERDGFIGLRDFRGDLIRLFCECGFIYHAEVTIWKDPVVAMQRTKALGLLHKQIKKDSCMSRMGIPDYVVFMRKPGDNPDRVTHTDEDFPVDMWQEYASPIWDEFNSPVWWHIVQSNTLNRVFNDPESERHICPLQLDVIERCLKMYSKEGDTVFTPFLGIGSEIYQAVKMGRKGIGIELKPEYFQQAKKNLMTLDNDDLQMDFESYFGLTT